MGDAASVYDVRSPGVRWRWLLHAALIVIASVAVYTGTLDFPFHWDGRYLLTQDPIISDLSYFMDTSQAEGMKFGNLLNSRYIGMLTFALNYKINGLDVTGYHIVNISIHIVNALLVYLLALLTFKTPRMAGNTINQRYKHQIALFAALLFAAHPLATQAVTYVVQRFASLATLLYLAAMASYIMFRIRSSVVEKSVLFVLALTSTVLAMKTKETAFTVPFSIALYELMFFEGDKARRLLYLMPFILTLPIIPLEYLRVNAQHEILWGSIAETTRLQTSISRLDYLLTESRVLITYIRLIFVPVRQSIDYDYPIFNSLLNPQVLLSIVTLAGTLLLAIYLHLKKSLHLIAFGIYWFFITLSVESSIGPIADVIAEHRLYLPLTWSVIAVAASVFKTFPRKATLILASVVIVFSFLTIERNSVWKSETALWEDAVAKAPGKARAHFNLASAYEADAELSKAEQQYLTTIRLNPFDAKAYNNLGNIYLRRGQAEKAIAHFEAASRLAPDDVDPLNNLGLTFSQAGEASRAIEYYRAALALKPENTRTRNNLALLYLSKGMTDEAMKEFMTSLRYNPKDPEAAKFIMHIKSMDAEKNTE